MQPKLFAFACLCVCVTSSAQQYPFVHYTPKDGLISNQVKNIYQDSKGRLYFSTFNGLSVYDGARFHNYSTKNGLPFDIVNATMEMGDDSIWVITNTSAISCLVKGKLKTLHIGEHIPVINTLVKDNDGRIYAGAEQGLYMFEKNLFKKLPFSDLQGRDVNFYLTNLIIKGDYLLIQRDAGLLREKQPGVYVYNRITKKVTDELNGVISLSQSTDGRLWVSTSSLVMAVDEQQLATGKLVLNELPEKFSHIKRLGNYFLMFDNASNCWLGNQNSSLIKASLDGAITNFSRSSGLGFFFINHIYTDKEGTVWIATNNAGVYKLVSDNFSIRENVFGLSAISNIFYSNATNHLLIYSSKMKKLLITKKDELVDELIVNNDNTIEQVFETPHGFYAVGNNFIFKMQRVKKSLQPQVIYADTADQEYTGAIVDKDGNLIVCGRNKIVGIINEAGNGSGKDIVYTNRLNAFADHLTADSKGNIWVATRSNELIKYVTHPGSPSKYLEEQLYLKDIYPGISPRSITIDKQDNIWIGTRNQGIHVFHVKGNSATHLVNINENNGLSDNFSRQLICDDNNNVWASSPSGLDKIYLKDGRPIIENQTRQNNIYQSVFKIVTDGGNNVWGLLSNGVLNIRKVHQEPNRYTPSMMISLARAGSDTISNSGDVVIPYHKNNLSFYFAAISFINESQILYSYRLRGGTNEQWSELSNNSSVSFVDLPPGDYVLDVKAVFPAELYPEKSASYRFSIRPPWWQTWWFKAVLSLVVIMVVVMIFRLYSNQKLERQKAAMERLQTIEKERTRIATDMHDDLGAGLSRIKYLSQSLLNRKQDEMVTPELEKITAFSDEMSEKMGEIIWALNEKNDTLADLIAYTRSYAVEYLASHAIECDAHTPFQLPETFITGEMRRNIFLAVKECLHNVVKHAAATKVHFSVSLNHNMQIVIHDNGKGLDENERRLAGNGLQNIQKRMHEIKGTVRYSNEKGTRVLLTIPVPV